MKGLIYIILFLSQILVTIGQVGIGTTKIHSSAQMELKSENQGFLIPRMTTIQRNAIVNPEEGLMIYNTEREALQFYRKNVGVSNNLNGWFDAGCEGDIKELLDNFPSGAILDFSDLAQNGKLFKGINGTGGEITSTDPTGTNVGSIGPFPSKLSDASVLDGYINFVDHPDNTSETGNLSDESGDHRFTFVNGNQNVANSYNASSFLSRSSLGSSNKIDLFKITFSDATPYKQDLDIILVARIDGATGNSASFFNNGNTSEDGSFQLGVGKGDEPANGIVPAGENGCYKDYFLLRNRTASGTFDYCGYTSASDDKRVRVDNKLHRFRIRYDRNPRNLKVYIDGNLIVDVSGNNATQITMRRFGLFNNRAESSPILSTVSFVGIFTSHLSNDDFDRFDKYLACKFETQP